MNALKERYKHLPEVQRIDRCISKLSIMLVCMCTCILVFYGCLPWSILFFRHRHLPKPIYKAAKLRRMVYDAEKKREDRKRAHSAPGAVPHPPARKKRIVAEIE